MGKFGIIRFASGLFVEIPKSWLTLYTADAFTDTRAVNLIAFTGASAGCLMDAPQARSMLIPRANIDKSQSIVY